MTTQDFINKAHAAQSDAGSQINFNQVVTTAMDAMPDQRITDPVALFVAAILYNNGGVNDATFEDVKFYASEIEKIAASFK